MRLQTYGVPARWQFDLVCVTHDRPGGALQPGDLVVHRYHGGFGTVVAYKAFRPDVDEVDEVAVLWSVEPTDDLQPYGAFSGNTFRTMKPPLGGFVFPGPAPVPLSQLVRRPAAVEAIALDHSPWFARCNSGPLWLKVMWRVIRWMSGTITSCKRSL